MSGVGNTAQTSRSIWKTSRTRAIAAALLALLGPAASASAAALDMRTGSFDGHWCGLSARFDIESREGSTWVFHGHVLIGPTGRYDPVWIEQ